MRKGTRIAIPLIIATLCVGNVGCILRLEGEGEFGFRQETNWAFYHRAHPNPQDNSASSEVASTVVDTLLEKETPEG